MSTENEQLVVELQARIDGFEKNFQAASKTANDNYDRMTASGREAGEKMSESIKGATDSITSSLNGLKGPAESVGVSLRAIVGGSIVAGFVGLAAKMNALIGDLAKAGDRAADLRLPINAIQALSVAADAARVPQDKLNSALDKFTEVSKKTTDDAADFYKALNNIGGGFETAFKNAPTQEARLRVISDALHSTTDEVKRAQLSLTAFGTDSERLMSILGSGGGGLDQARRQLHALGLEIDETAVKRAQDARTQLSLLSRTLTDELSTSLAGLIPTFRNLIPYMESLAGVVRDVLAIFAKTDADKPIETLQNEVATLTKQLSDVEALRDRMTTNQPSKMDTLRDQLRAIIGPEIGVDLSENVADLDKQIADIKERIATVNSLIAQKQNSSPTKITIPAAFKPRPSLTQTDDEDKTAFERQVDHLSKHVAALRADAAAVGLTTAAHEKLRAELALLQAVERDDDGATNAQIDTYARLRQSMSAQQALAASGITLNRENAQAFGEVTTRVGDAAQKVDDYKTKFAGMNDALRFGGNELVDVLDRASQKGADFGQIMKDVLRNVEKQLLTAAITGEGALGKLFGTASTTGGVGGLLGALAGLFGGARAEGGPVDPGKAYVVGERRPEIFIPKTPGTILPSIAKISGGGMSVGIGQQNTFHSNVTVNATGGRPQDNQDLAEKVGRAVKEATAAMIAQEIRTQMKPGGLYYR